MSPTNLPKKNGVKKNATAKKISSAGKSGTPKKVLSSTQPTNVISKSLEKNIDTEKRTDKVSSLASEKFSPIQPSSEFKSSNMNNSNLNSTSSQPSEPKTPKPSRNLFWKIATIVLALVFGLYLLYQYVPQVHNLVQPKPVVQNSQQVAPIFTLPLTVVYNTKNPGEKEKIQAFTSSITDPQKGLQLTELKETWLDFESPEGVKLIAESGTKYLPIAFVDKTIEQHPQFNAIQSYLQKKGDHYYFHLYPLQHLETPPISGGHVKGAELEKAEVVVLEYGSFTCHFCHQMEEVLTQVLKDFPGKISLVYKNFNRIDVDNLLAEASECANDENKFWEMHDELYKDQANFVTLMEGTKTEPEKVIRTYVEKLAKNIGLNNKNFLACYDSKKHAKIAQDNTLEATTFGISGTPAFFINGKFQDGAVSYEDFKKLIEEAIAAKKK